MSKKKDSSQKIFAPGTVRSMTGYGEASEVCSLPNDAECSIKVQCKSVNHRFADITCKLPSRYSAYEIFVQRIVKSKIQRGKVDIFVSRETSGVEYSLELNTDLIKTSFEKIEELDSKGVKKEQVQAALLAALFQKREVLELSSHTLVDESEKELLERVVTKAIDALVDARREEGLALEKEVKSILSQIDELVTQIDTFSQSTPEVVKKRFEDRLSALYAHYSKDDQRMLQEIAILADRIDIREEIVRLKSHIKGFTKALSEGGRKLEFIVQEMGREINTIGSKTAQIEISAHVITVKSLLEKLREQLQNIE